MRSRAKLCAAVIEFLEHRRLLATTFISLPSNVHDFVFDSTRNVMYATVQNGTVARYNLATRTLLSSWFVGGQVLGMDITPANDALWLADASSYGGQWRFWKVNTSSGAASYTTFNGGGTTWGAFDISIVNSNIALANGAYSNTPPLQINLATGAVTPRTDYSRGYLLSNSPVSRSGDRSTVFLEGTSIFSPSPAPIAVYRTAGDDFIYDNTWGFAEGRETAVNRNGSLIAMPRSDGAAILTNTFSSIRTINGIDGGMLFDPNRDIFYGLKSGTNEVIAYDTNTWTEKWRIPAGFIVGTSNNLLWGEMAVDASGTTLFTNDGGHGFYVIDLPQATASANRFVLSAMPNVTKAGLSNSVTLRVLDPAGNAATAYTGTVHFTSSDVAAGLPADYTFTPADNGQHTFNVTFNSTGAKTLTVKDTSNATLTATANTAVHNGIPAILPIVNAHEMVVDPVRNILYASTGNGLIERFNLSTQQMMTPFVVGNSLNGIDVTADGNFVYVAEGVRGATQTIFRKVDTTTGAVTNINHDVTDSRQIGLDIAITGNRAFAATDLDGIYQMDLPADVMTRRDNSTDRATFLETTFDHSRLLLQGSLFFGNVGFYDAVNDKWNPVGNLSDPNRTPAAVSRDGSMTAFKTQFSTVIVNAAFQQIAQFGIDGGMIFDPIHDIFYGVNSSTDQIFAYDTHNWTQKYFINIGEDVPIASGWGTAAPGVGTMAIDANGTQLFLTTPTGVRVFAIPQPGSLASISATGFPTFTRIGVSSPFTVRALDPTGDVVPGYRGTVHFFSNDPTANLPADYTFTAADNGVHTFFATFNSAGGRYLAATDAANGFTSVQNGLTIHAGNVSLLPVTMGAPVLDAAHGILYGIKNQGTIQRYNISTETLLPPIILSSWVYGLDVTPDGNTLYATVGESIAGQKVIRKIDLTTGSISTLTFPLNDAYASTYGIAVGADGRALVTTYGSDPPQPLRQIDLASGAITVRSDISSTESLTFLRRSLDYRRIFLEGFRDFIALYDTTSGVWKTAHAGDRVRESPASVNRDGSMVAVYTGTDNLVYTLRIMDSDLKIVRTLLNIDGGGAFDPLRPIFYAIDTKVDQFIAYDTDTWQEKYRLNIGQDINVSNGTNLAPAVSADGTKLFLATSAGLRIYNIPQHTQQAVRIGVAAPTFAKAGNHVSVVVTPQDPSGDPATLYRGTVHFTSSDPLAVLPADYTFTAADNGSHAFDFVFNTTGSQSVTVSDVSNPAITGVQSGITIHNGATLIPLTLREDLVFDPFRNRLYITTENGAIQRYDLATQSLLTPFMVESYIHGADITPDGQYLIVAETWPDPVQSLYHKIDLDTGQVTKLRYDRFASEFGAYDVAIGSNGIAVGSTESGILRKLDISTGLVTSLGINQLSSRVTRDDNRDLMFMIGSGTGGSFAFTYNPLTDTFGATRQFTTFGGNFSAMNADGSLIATGMGTSAVILNSTDLSIIATLPQQTIGGLIFHPSGELIEINAGLNQITGVDTSTGNARWQFPVGESLSYGAFYNGEMALSSDGNTLFLSTQLGVRVYNLKGAPAISGFPALIQNGTSGSFTVAARGPAGNIDPRYRGTIHFTSNDPSAILPADYTFTEADHGVHNFAATLNTAGLRSITVTDLATSETSTQGGINVSGVSLLSGLLSVFGGSGDDQISYGPSDTGIQVGLNGALQNFDPALITAIDFRTFDGKDFVWFAPNPAQTYDIPGGLVDLGSGDDQVEFYSQTGPSLLQVLGAAGNDQLVYSDRATVPVNFDGGDGTDTISFTPSDDNTIFNVSSSAISSGSHAITYGNVERPFVTAHGGNNSYLVTSLAASQILQVAGTNGDDTLEIAGGLAGALVNFDSGNGNDSLTVRSGYLGNVNYGNPASPSGADSILFEGGIAADTVHLRFNSVQIGSRTVSFSGNATVRVNSLGGNDTLDLDTSGNVGVSWTIDTGDGNDSFTSQNTSGPITVLGGAGTDTITFNGGNGAFVADGGAGTDTLAVISNGSPLDIRASSILNGARTIDFSQFEQLNVPTSGNAITNVLAAALPILVSGGSGDDIMSIGDGTLDSITSRVTLGGGGGPDSITIHDEFNTRADSYTFTTTTSLTRSGLQPITYSSASVVKLLAGSGNNLVTLPGALGQNQTIIDAGDGDDTISLSGSYTGTTITTNVIGGNGSDILNFATTGAPTVSFAGGAGADTLNVNSGTFTLAQDARLSTDSLSINLAGTSILLMNASQHLASLKILSNARATLAASGSSVLAVNQLDATGKLDLTNNNLIIQATAATRLAVLATIEGRIRNAYGTSAPHWQGSGITSSTAAANAARAVGVLLNSTGGSTFQTFAGDPVNENSILVAYTVAGDLNLDRTVTVSDFIDLSSNFNTSGGWRQGDGNYDGVVSIADFIDLSANFNQSVETPAQPSPQAPAASGVAAADSEAKRLRLNRATKTTSDRRSPRPSQLHHRRHKHQPLKWRSRMGVY